MTVRELMKFLSLSELSNLTVTDTKDEEESGIKQKYQNAIVTFIYEGLNKLYANYYLKEDSIYLEVIDGKTRYEITSEHLLGEDLEADYDHYLWKPGKKPFNNDILRIIRIIDSTGRILPLNNPEKFNSVFTPLYNCIDIQNLTDEHELEIIYAAKHPSISYEENTELELPISLFPAIRAYVAYLVHMNMNTETAVQNAQKYLNQYNLIITENIQSDAAFTKVDDRACKFVLGGWV